MAMYNTNNGKAMSKARMAIVAGTLALSMSPVVAIAQTQGTATSVETTSVETTTGTDTNRPPITQFENRGDSNGFRMMGERPELPMNADGTMAEPPTDGQAPMNEDGTMAEPPTDGQAPTDADGNRLEPPAKPEGDLAPELPEGEQPQLTGERPELPTNADGTMAEPPADGKTTTNADGTMAEPPADGKTSTNVDGTSTAPTNEDGTMGELPAKPEGDQANGGEQDRPFFDRIGDFFRQMFDWISGTGRE